MSDISRFEWAIDHENRIKFVMIDGSGNEVTGIGNTFSLFLSKNGGAFNAGLGAKNELGYGWYDYLTTVAEADTAGPVAVEEDSSDKMGSQFFLGIESLVFFLEIYALQGKVSFPGCAKAIEKPTHKQWR